MVDQILTIEGVPAGEWQETIEFEKLTAMHPDPVHKSSNRSGISLGNSRSTVSTSNSVSGLGMSTRGSTRNGRL